MAMTAVSMLCYVDMSSGGPATPPEPGLTNGHVHVVLCDVEWCSVTGR